MDLPAIALARDNKLPILICSIQEEDCFIKAIQGEGIFTLVNTRE
jgi:uridylate kinase